jgi:ATP-binding cassette subfamily C protein LapB
MPIVILYALSIQSPLRHAIERTFRASSQKNATLVESLTGAETIKTLSAEGQVQYRWEQAVAFIAKFGVRARLLSTSAVNVATFFQQLATVGIVIYGVYLITEGELSMGGLIACVILTGRAMAPMAQVTNIAVNYHRSRTALKSLNSIMELPVDRDKEKQFVSRSRLNGGIEFHNVNFTYPGQTVPALSNVSFRIRPGEHVALIGRIGSGKTTIEKLILGLYDPDSGAVRIDGIDVRQMDPNDLRHNIGYVAQDPVLFFGSVKDNIRFGAPYIGDDDILRAARIAGIDEFVDKHPSGYDMQVGERGESLSGGQRKSVVIARALVLDPPLLLLDEPSNSMDNTTEQRLKANLTEYVSDRTMMVVTHRASMLDLVDRIMVMDGGRIVADGPKEQVLEALKGGKLRGAQN